MIPYGQLRIVRTIVLMFFSGAAAILLPRPWGIAIFGVVLVGVLLWWLLPRNRWKRYRPPVGWTFAAADPAFTPPAAGRLDPQGGEVRHVLRGTLHGWPLVAWEQKAGPQFAWRCALDVGFDLPSWSARPLAERNSLAARFPDEYHFSPDMLPELKKVMARDNRALAWHTAGRWVVAEEPVMDPWHLPAWFEEQGRVLREVAAVLATELSPRQLRLAPTPPALPAAGPARNVWQPEDAGATPPLAAGSGDSAGAVEPWRQPEGFPMRSDGDAP